MMHRSTAAVLMWSMVAVLACSWFAGAQPDLQREVMSTIDGAIRLIQREQYVELMTTYFRPSEVEELVARFESVEKAAAAFTRTGRQVALLAVLQAAAKSEPRFEREGTIAVFRFDPPVGKERGLSLQKIGARWYLRD